MPCPVSHALATHYFLRLTRARGKSSQREGNALFDDFWYFWSRKSTIKEKFLYVKDNTSSTAIAVPLLPLEKALYPLFLLHIQAQKKKLSKRKRRKKISRSAERLPSLGDADTHAPRMCQFPPLSVDDTAFPKRRAKTTVWRAKTSWCAKNFREKVARSGIHLLRRASRTSS